MSIDEDRVSIKIPSNEAIKLASYLVGKPIGHEVTIRYEMAVQIKQVSLNSHEQRVWNLMLSYSLILTSVDSYLALTDRNCPIRKRICIMLAILEAHPNYISSFYFKRPQFIDHMNLLFSLFTTPFKVVLGILIIKLY